MSEQSRLDKIMQLEDVLGENHRVLTLVNMRRSIEGIGPKGTQIAPDVIALMLDHLMGMSAEVGKEVLVVDLFLVSPGGETSVPWRIASMIREFASKFNVLVPQYAMSAATLICLGADSIFMGPRGELGPVDITIQNHPMLPKAEKAGQRTPDIISDTVSCPVSVEDVTSYIDFVKSKYGVRGPKSLTPSLNLLTQQIPAILIGIVNRQHAYIRMLASKLLESRQERMPRRQRKRIITALVEEVTFHGHAISRTEAREELRLHVSTHPRQADLESIMWDLYKAYEEDFKHSQALSLCQMQASAGSQSSFQTGDIPLGAIESRSVADIFNFQFSVEEVRQQAPELKLAFQLPPSLDTQKIDPQLLQEHLKQLAAQITPEVQKAIHDQMPVTGVNVKVIKEEWERVRP